MIRSTTRGSQSIRTTSLQWVKVAGATLLTLGSVGQILGCALTSKAEQIDVRYFEPRAPHAASSADTPATSPTLSQNLQMGRVTASAYLKSRLVYRTSSYELGAYDDRQWTERPEEYLRRDVSSALYNGRGITHSLSDGPMLDVELTNFEEMRSGKKSSGRVTIRYSLHDDQSVWMTDSITVDEPTKDGSQKPEDVVAAISDALDRATTKLADKVEARLKERPTPTPSPPPTAH